MNMASSPILLIIIFSMWLLIPCSESTEYLVGDGKKSWRFPLPSFHAFTNWASTHQFTIGDTIVFEYDNRKESVHEVDEHDYIKCNTRGHNHVKHYDGNTKVVLEKVGVRYFISGRKGHCKMGLKVAVIVSSPLPPSPFSPPSPLPSPRPSLSPLPSPSPLPSSLLSPSPNSSGSKGGANDGGFIMWLGILLAMMMF